MNDKARKRFVQEFADVVRKLEIQRYWDEMN